MAQGFLTGADPTEVWFRPGGGKSISQSVAQASVVLIVLLLVVAGYYVVFESIVEEERFDDRILVVALASMLMAIEVKLDITTLTETAELAGLGTAWGPRRRLLCCLG